MIQNPEVVTVNQADADAPQPLESTTAFRLPREAYRSSEWLQREHELVFETTWSLVATVDDLPETGDAIDVTVGRYLLIVTRTASGLRAFHNMCRHRGMALVCGPINTGASLRCPYHGWEFSTDDGALTRIPQRTSQFGDADLTALGLLPASVAVWEGLVFAHPSAAAPSFDTFLGDFPAGMGSFRPGQLEQVARIEIRGHFNWKLFVENHIDVYHLWYLHDRSLADFDHRNFEHNHRGPHWMSYEPMRPDACERARQNTADTIDHLDDRDRYGIGAHLLFPNMTMASTADYFITYAVFPVGPTESRIDLRVRSHPGADVPTVIADIRSFIDEDILACERVQLAIESPAFEVGPLARTHEHPITLFHDELLARLDVAGTPVDEPLRRAAQTA